MTNHGKSGLTRRVSVRTHRGSRSCFQVEHGKDLARCGSALRKGPPVRCTQDLSAPIGVQTRCRFKLGRDGPFYATGAVCQRGSNPFPAPFAPNALFTHLHAFSPGKLKTLRTVPLCRTKENGKPESCARSVVCSKKGPPGLQPLKKGRRAANKPERSLLRHRACGSFALDARGQRLASAGIPGGKRHPPTQDRATGVTEPDHARAVMLAVEPITDARDRPTLRYKSDSTRNKPWPRRQSPDLARRPRRRPWLDERCNIGVSLSASAC